MRHETRDVGRRIANCSKILDLRLKFGESGQVSTEIEGAKFCQARLCPFCEWRRMRVWRARLATGLERLHTEKPKLKAVFLTLTVRNCHLNNLRDVIADMHHSFRRLGMLSAFPTSYWFRRTEVTISRSMCDKALYRDFRGKLGTVADHPAMSGIQSFLSNEATDLAAALPITCHPHLHVLLMVPPRYFGPDYISQLNWQKMWQASARLDYAPVIDIRRAYDKQSGEGRRSAPWNAVLEAAKYCTKATDFFALGPALADFHDQMKSLRLIGVSKALREYIVEEDPTVAEMVDVSPDAPMEAGWVKCRALWNEAEGRYRIES